MRAQMVLMAADGLRNDEIAAQLRCGRDVVSQWRKRLFEQRGALCYFAAWDAGRARPFDRCAPTDGIVPFDALVEQFMSTEPSRNAPRGS
ncbi:MAG: helix-turn-helix domain-containing protein [Solirubrobacteraceae bacterium]